MKKTKFVIACLLLLMVGVAESWGQNVTVTLKVQALLDGELLEEGDPRNPDVKITNVTTGEVYTQCPLTVINDAGSTDKNRTWKFPYTLEILNRSDYSFKGWATSKSSTSLKTDNPYCVSANNSFGNLSTTKTYYVYIHSEEAVEPTGTDGVALKSVSNNSFVAGSSSSDWIVKLSFDEKMTYDSSTPQSGANKDVMSWISIKDTDTDAIASFTSVYTTSDGSAIMSFPYSMAASKYNVHLPYGLFTTVEGHPSAPCNFEIVVLGDDAPFLLTDTEPTNEKVWSAKYTDSDGNVGINSFALNITFSKHINRINLNGKDLSLHHQETGKSIACKGANINFANKNIANLSYGIIPNGHYTVNIPEGVFIDGSGNTNESFTLSFTVTDSEDTWTLPTFETLSTVSGKEPYFGNAIKIVATYSSETYGHALSLMPQKEGERISASVMRTQKGQTDLDEIGQVEIPGVTASFSDGNIEIQIPMVNFTTKNPFSSGGNINITIDKEEPIFITIPKGYVINKPADEATDNLETLYKAGACTNAKTDIQFTAMKVQKGDVNADGLVDLLDVDELLKIVFGQSRKTNTSDLNEDDNISTSDITELVKLLLDISKN